MNHFLSSYFNSLASHPDRADYLLLWTVCTLFMWFWIVFFRNKIIEGQTKEGTNKADNVEPSWETREIIIFFSLMAYFPISFYITFLTTYKLWGAAAVILPVWYQIFGRFIFDWILAFKGGLSEVPEHEKEKTTVKTEVKTEVQTQPQ